MIFSNFISSAKPADEEDAPLEGASAKLLRLMKVSSSKLIGKQQQQHQRQQQQQQQQQRSETTTTTKTTTTPNTSPSPKTIPLSKRAVDWQLEHKYTLSEVQQHSSLDDCWMVIFDKVYDITDFVDAHPGGDFILLEYAGRDATQPFLSSRHGSSAYKMLDKYWIGILVDEELYYSNNSSYCSVYSNLSWRSTPIASPRLSLAGWRQAGGHAQSA